MILYILYHLSKSSRPFGANVFASSVQSGFLPPKRATVDHNRSRTDPDIEGTELNHIGPVFCGLWSRFRPIQTGFFAYNLLYQYKPFVSRLLLL
ncbi:uncharacterized protein LACBIDRAFT_306439 [Laccaria bicolor S238N-H82]|uniref:Predicted protein n=1 Tax=Laccaria bicolor (strain S238N-H82 / ATCC MYA-4686) TaxID=486041 RepID=B0DMX6_LACBS|nr:uncharacterized protein LACBIDRAFT_306439 [Laccaria bicolor S238N-H82]EDR04126.1 predicted protein [Laccaria bicolor S238N-H82]|eukprot:XP_001885381.1 predicted protein [Laccaria bicolor S238N-H82]